MTHIHDYIRDHILQHIDNEKMPSLETLEKTEWSNEFERFMRERFMRERLIIGAFRYGRINKKNKPKWDRIKDISKRLNLYNNTHNTELLVDIANLCLLEFIEGNHKDKHFESKDHNIHTQVKDSRCVNR